MKNPEPLPPGEWISKKTAAQRKRRYKERFMPQKEISTPSRTQKTANDLTEALSTTYAPVYEHATQCPTNASSENQILTILKHAAPDSRHQNVGDIYKNLIRAGKKLSPATIYRALYRMEDKGIIVRNNFKALGTTYELSPTEKHIHFHEAKSSKIFDVKSDQIEDLLLAIAEDHDVELVDFKMVLFVRKQGDA